MNSLQKAILEYHKALAEGVGSEAAKQVREKYVREQPEFKDYADSMDRVKQALQRGAE